MKTLPMPKDSQQFCLAVLELVFDLGRQGDWYSDMINTVEADGGVNPERIARELLSNVGGVSSVVADVEQAYEMHNA